MSGIRKAIAVTFADDESRRIDVTLVDLTIADALAELQSLVGGYVEVVPTSDEVVMWCNEGGKLLGLRHNAVADVAWSFYDVHGCIIGGDWLAGNIVITGPGDGDAPEGLFDKLVAAAERWNR